MGLRLLGGSIAVLLCIYAVVRYRNNELKRGEVFLVAVVAAGLAVAAVTPDALDPALRALGFERGGERRIIGLLVLANLLTLMLLFAGAARRERLSVELGTLVDNLALARLKDDGAPDLRDACAVVIPAFDEADNLPGVLASIPPDVAGLPVRTIVVADGCTDDTEAVAKGLGAIVVRRDLRRGSGAAVRLGYEVARRGGAAVIVTLDADGQHDPREMERLVAPLVSGEADMVQGSRVLGTFEVESRVRAAGVRVFARVLSLLARTRITDPSTGYRALTAEALARLHLKQDQFYVSELILDAVRKGLRVKEVPISIRRRNSGLTKKPKPLRYALGFGRAILRTWLR